MHRRDHCRMRVTVVCAAHEDLRGKAASDMQMSDSKGQHTNTLGNRHLTPFHASESSR